MRKILDFYNNNLSIWVIILSIFAYFTPFLFIKLKPFINIFFAITMFGIGLVITEDDYSNIIKSPADILLGNICQFLIMPLLAIITSIIFNLPKPYVVGLILTGSAPGAMTSNVITYLSRGDTAYSVSLTALATLLCPILTPLLTLILAGRIVPIPFLSMFMTIIYTVVLPLLLGFIFRRKFPILLKRIGKIPPAISVSAIVIICSFVVAVNKNNLGKVTLIIFMAVLFHNISGMGLGYLAGGAFKFNFIRKKTLSIEIGMQNAGLGVVLALKHFSSDVAIPGAIFTIWCIISASILVNFWKYIEKKRNVG